ncbi:ribokinase [Mycoplasmatota bacterium WC30]
MKKIIVAGSLNMDLVFSVNRLPEKGETTKGQGFLMNAGGKGANQATCCSKLGCQVYMIGSVGSDVFGQNLIDTLEKSGVDTHFVNKVNNISTGIAGIIVIDGDNRIILEPAANDSVDCSQIVYALEEIAEPGDILLTQFEIPYQAVLLSMQKAKSLNMITILNPAPAYIFDEIFFKYIDIITPNEIEAEMITGFKRTDKNFNKKVVEFFLQKGVKEVILTLGQDGAVYGKKGIFLTFPVWDVDVVDTTAAGDTFVGTIASELAKDTPMIDAISKATAAAAITVSRHGAQAAIPKESEILAFMKKERL